MWQVTSLSGQMERRGRRRKLKWLQQHKSEKSFEKPEEVISGLSQIHLAAFADRDQIFKAGNYGDHSPEPVDETMSGNKFHCKNK